MGRNQNKSWHKPKRQSEFLDDKMEVENTPPPPAKRPKQAEWTKEAVVPSEKFDVLGGCEEQFLKACRLSVHMRFPEIYERLGVVAPKGFLLHGPPGTGKTTFAKALAGELNLPLISVSSTEVVAGISGESEKRIREVFAKAAESAPAVLLLDDIDVIAAKRENAQREMERRIVAQLIASMDELENTRILVIGTTSRLEVLDSSLRRAGRFDKDISIGIPDERARTKILEIVTKDLKMDGNITLQQLARLTPGYVGADLKAFVREASLCAVDRIFENVLTNNDSHGHNGAQKMEHIVLELQRMRDWLNSPPVDFASKLENICVEVADFRRALSIVVPSAKREGFATVPDVSWSDIGALRGIRRELEWSILKPIQQPEVFDALNFSPKPQGILLCGPPGCGKTLLGKAIAHEAGMNFISVKGPELISMYVGESERAVRTIFQRANDSSPCVIFFDEIDALCPKRSNFETSGSSRLVNQLLTEMDGMENRKQVFLIGATNRPDMVDPAILRPGRLDRTLYVGFPTAEDRTEILMKITKDGRHPRISENFSFGSIAPKLESYTGADLVALVGQAAKFAAQQFEEDGSTNTVTLEHFEKAIAEIKPSVDRKHYEEMEKKYAIKGRMFPERPFLHVLVLGWLLLCWVTCLPAPYLSMMAIVRASKMKCPHRRRSTNPNINATFQTTEWIFTQGPEVAQTMNYHLLMWIRSLVPLNITPLPAIRRLVSSLDFLYHLRDGTLLAQLANALVPGCVACNFDVNTGDVALNLEKRNRNLEGFVAFLKEHADFGEEFVFHPEDVRNKYDDSYKTVFSCLYKLATEVPEKFGKHGLNIDCVIKDANQEQERNFRLRFKADSLKSRWNNTDCDSVIQLRVMTVHRQIIRLYVDAKDTVSNLKEQLEVKRGIAVQDQRLSFSGNVLDDKLSLSHYGIHNGSEVLCISLKDCEQTLFNGRF